jgi:sugar lactone lactonase YvrE
MPARLIGALIVLLALAASAAAAAPLRTVVAFDAAAKQTPENLAVAGDGTIYVSLAFAGKIRRIAPRRRPNDAHDANVGRHHRRHGNRPSPWRGS